MKKYGIGFWGLSTIAQDDKNRIDIAAKLGFSSIDVDLSHFDNNCDKQKVKEYYEDLYEYGKSKGVSFYQSHAPFISFPNYLFESYFANIVECIKISSYLHCKYMIMHPQIFAQANFECDLEAKEFQYNVEFYKKLIPYLEKYDVTICLENVYDWDRSVKPAKIRLVQFSNPEILVQLVDAISSKNFGFCLDTGHMNLAHYKQSKAILAFNSRLYALHIHDNYEVKDDHFRLHEGNIDWEDFAKALKEINFTGVFNYEIKPLSTEMDYYSKAYADLIELINRYYD